MARKEEFDFLGMNNNLYKLYSSMAVGVVLNYWNIILHIDSVTDILLLTLIPYIYYYVCVYIYVRYINNYTGLYIKIQYCH